MYPQIEENKQYIILAGFAAGILFALGILPQTTTYNIPFKNHLNWVYAALIGFACFVYYSLYIQETPKRQPPRSYPKPVFPQYPPIRPRMPPTTQYDTPEPQKPKGIMEQVGEIVNQK